MTSDEILALYDRRRAISRAQSDDLTGRLSRRTLEDIARRVGILQHGTLVFGSESELTVLSDLCVFDHWEDGENVIRRALRTQPPPAGTTERAVMEAYAEARFSVFSAVRTEPGLGVYVRDMLRPGQVTFVVDRGLALSPSGFVMAARIVSFPEFAMTTGAGIPVTDPATVQAIGEALTRGFGAVSVEEIDRLPPKARSEFALIVVRVLLSRGESGNVRYAERPDLIDPRDLEGWGERPSQPSQPVRVEPRAGRNEPCPCGSGRKFKRCHGART